MCSSIGRETISRTGSGVGRRRIKFVELPPGSDLLGAFLEEALAVHREGCWELTELTARFGWFIAHKRGNFGDTLMVSIDDRDPKLSR